MQEQEGRLAKGGLAAPVKKGSAGAPAAEAAPAADAAAAPSSNSSSSGEKRIGIHCLKVI